MEKYPEYASCKNCVHPRCHMYPLLEGMLDNTYYNQNMLNYCFCPAYVGNKKLPILKKNEKFLIYGETTGLHVGCTTSISDVLSKERGAKFVKTKCDSTCIGYLDLDCPERD